MDGEFVKEFQEAVQRPVEVVGELVIPPHWYVWDKPIAQVPAIQVGTLTGFLQYIKDNTDAIDRAKCLVHIVSPTTVELRGPLEGEEVKFRRHTYMRATTDLVGIQPFPWGTYLDKERFFIGLQTSFAQTYRRDNLMMFVMSIRESNVRETVDDKVSQQVTVVKGVHTVANADVPNPVLLQPYRTFREVEQPESSFILRMKSGSEQPSCALFESDGGAWKLEAIQSIASYLKGQLGETIPILA